MRTTSRFFLTFLLLVNTFPARSDSVTGWLNWRGPNQNGTSSETGLPETWQPGGENHLWTYPVAGRGTAVIAGARVYALGYEGEGPDLQEYLLCLSAESGELLWKIGFNDFLSDIIYRRYTIGSPTVDPETGNIFILTTPGILACVSPDGKVLWQISMMEQYGRLTFPNGRTGSPVIESDLVIVNAITSNWGKQGPARNRFYAFDKSTGELVWASTPGVRPRDSSFSTPVLGWANGKRVFYCGTGCGNIVCVNARTGDPLWRFQMSYGGVNSSVLLYGEDRLIAIHGKENIDSSDTGRMVCLKIGQEPAEGEKGPVVLGRQAEVWRAPLSMFTSSPVLAGNRVYQVVHTGELVCVEADTGEILWEEKLAESQLHASPMYADGKLYVPMLDGSFYIIRPSDERAEILCKTQLEGNCLGAPSVWNGRIYQFTTEKLYCFGSEKGGNPPSTRTVRDERPSSHPGTPVRIQAIPSEVLMRPNERRTFRLFALDANGFRVGPVANPVWESFIPPTAKVKSRMEAHFDEEGVLVTEPGAELSAGAFRVTSNGLSGTIRGRVLPALPYEEDFEGFETTVPHPSEEGVTFAYPPLPWIGARFKWEIRERDGNKVLAKTLDNVLFQRAITFIGTPDMHDYTVQADILTDGNRRMRSTAGVINQRYLIALIGNAQRLEVSSNQDRIKVSVPFRWKPGEWYRMKTRVDLSEDGSGVVRAKAWKVGEEEPKGWTLEVPHKVAHKHGSPGLFGFAPQSRFRVYVDNVKVIPNR